MERLDFPISTQISKQSHDDIVFLASIEKSSVGRILRNALLVEIERRRAEIENYKRLRDAA